MGILVEADTYEIGIHRERGALMLRLTDEEAGHGAFLALPADEAYVLAHRILRGYDELEGI